MKVLRDIRGIVFDAYGTLFHVGSLVERLAHHFGQDAAVIGPTWRAKQLEYTWLRALMGNYVPFSQITADALHFACEQHNVLLEMAVSRELTQEYYRLASFDEVSTVLSELRSSYQLAVLSNANPEMLYQALKSNELMELMDGAFSVDEVKTYKPSPEVYQLAVDGLKLSKEELLFISTNTWDVAGAKSFGFYTIWLNRFNKKLEVLGLEPDHEIRDLNELL